MLNFGETANKKMIRKIANVLTVTVMWIMTMINSQAPPELDIIYNQSVSTTSEKSLRTSAFVDYKYTIAFWARFDDPLYLTKTSEYVGFGFICDNQAVVLNHYDAYFKILKGNDDIERVYFSYRTSDAIPSTYGWVELAAISNPTNYLNQKWFHVHLSIKLNVGGNMLFSSIFVPGTSEALTYGGSHNLDLSLTNRLLYRQTSKLHFSTSLNPFQGPGFTLPGL